MIGAMIGDIVGSRFEWNSLKSKDFELFAPDVRFTDDTAMTVAVAEGILQSLDTDDEEYVRSCIREQMRLFGNRYPYAGYGGHFIEWLADPEMGTYGSYGNGSAMRVSSAGWLFDDPFTTRRYARLSAEVTHNHPEGLKGAESVAMAIFWARKGKDKVFIREYIETEFGYDLSATCDAIRPGYSFDVSCQGSVPQSIIAFLESDSFEDAVRNAISLGGDTDTMGAMAGSIAEAYYGIPEDIKAAALDIIPEDMREVVRKFEAVKAERAIK